MAGESMNINKICKNVGWDGKSFFCMLCGKTGFGTVAKVLGHQCQCQARRVKK